MTSINQAHLTTGNQSPFLPGTKIQFAWDSTSLGLFKTCPRLYQYTMIDGWGHSGESIHLRFGIEYHQALQEYDILRAEGISHADAIRNCIRNLLNRTMDFNPEPDTKVGKYKNRNTLLSLVLGYLDHYENDPAETYIMQNGRPAVELSFRFELDWGPESQHEKKPEYKTDPEGYINEYPPFQPYVLCGHLDRVVNFNDQLLVMDHKTTTTTISPSYFAQWEPNNQMSLYTIAGQIVLGTPIKGVCITAAQILLTEPPRYIRGFTYRTPDQIEEWLSDLHQHLSLAEHYAKQDYWPMNDTACDKFGGCRFRGICSKDPNVREAFLKADFEKLEEDKRWNPLRSR